MDSDDSTEQADTIDFNPIKIINEVKKYPALYDSSLQVDRNERLKVWRQAAAAICPDWDKCSKAKMYDRVLQLQKKWRNLKDTYNREVRRRKSGAVTRKRMYRYFHHMTFLSKDQDGSQPGCDEGNNLEPLEFDNTSTDDPLLSTKTPKKTVKKTKQEPGSSEGSVTLDDELPMFHIAPTDDNEDADKLFLLSFVPEMRQLPLHIKMWARSKIANIMQEAIENQYSNSLSSFRGLRKIE